MTAAIEAAHAEELKLVQEQVSLPPRPSSEAFCNASVERSISVPGSGCNFGRSWLST